MSVGRVNLWKSAAQRALPGGGSTCDGRCSRGARRSSSSLHQPVRTRSSSVATCRDCASSDLSTIGSSILVFFALLAVARLPRKCGSVLDLMAAAFCFALARPVAWADHFGIAMPIFAVLLIAHE